MSKDMYMRGVYNVCMCMYSTHPYLSVGQRPQELLEEEGGGGRGGGEGHLFVVGSLVWCVFDYLVALGGGSGCMDPEQNMTRQLTFSLRGGRSAALVHTHPSRTYTQGARSPSLFWHTHTYIHMYIHTSHTHMYIYVYMTYTQGTHLAEVEGPGGEDSEAELGLFHGAVPHLFVCECERVWVGGKHIHTRRRPDWCCVYTPCLLERERVM